jgi:probable rRNA maturation factor
MWMGGAEYSPNPKVKVENVKARFFFSLALIREIRFGCNKKTMEINVLIEEGLEAAPDAERLQRIVEATLNAENAPPSVEISLVITGQERIQELNREYRGADRPTDVLSFALSEKKAGEEPEAFIEPPDGLIHLGEVIISYPQAEIQAREQGHSVNREMAVLTVHGVLHILGYDHEVPEDETAMRAREKQVLEGLEKEIE